MSVGHQIKLEYIVYPDKLDNLTCTDLNQSANKEVVSVYHETKPIIEGGVRLTKVVGVEILNNCCEVLALNALHLDSLNLV